jgi:hypothetical protein
MPQAAKPPKPSKASERRWSYPRLAKHAEREKGVYRVCSALSCCAPPAPSLLSSPLLAGEMGAATLDQHEEQASMGQHGHGPTNESVSQCPPLLMYRVSFGGRESPDKSE